MNYNALFGESWGPKLQEEISPKKLKYIFDRLKEESSQAQILPKSETIFNCFKLCPVEKTMIVFLGANPYYNQPEGVSNGLLFGSETVCTKISRLLWAAVCDNFDKEVKLNSNRTSLENWAKQGVLLLPLDLTTSSQKKGAFIRLWEPFIEAVIRTIQNHCPGVIFVLLGQDALKIAKNDIDPLNHDIVCLEHPVKALLLKRNFKHKNIFNYLDRVTNMIFGRKIDWYA
jgi:uracil-DNA glycosylase